MKVSPEARFLGHSFRSMMPEEMYLLRRHYPADFERLRLQQCIGAVPCRAAKRHERSSAAAKRSQAIPGRDYRVGVAPGASRDVRGDPPGGR